MTKVFDMEEIESAIQACSRYVLTMEDLLEETKYVGGLPSVEQDLQCIINTGRESHRRLTNLYNTIFSTGDAASYFDYIKKTEEAEAKIDVFQNMIKQMSEQLHVSNVTNEERVESYFVEKLQQFHLVGSIGRVNEFAKAGIDLTEVVQLITFGYTELEILDIYNSLISNEDKEMFHKIASGKYKDAFDMDYENISVNMYTFLADYEIRLMDYGLHDKTTSEDDDLHELENFLNALFSTNDGSPYFGSENTIESYTKNGVNKQSNQYHHALAIQSSIDLLSFFDTLRINGDTTSDEIVKMRADYMNREAIKTLNSSIMFKMLENKSSVIAGGGYSYDYKISGIDVKLDTSILANGEINFKIKGATKNVLCVDGVYQSEKQLSMKYDTELITSVMEKDVDEFKRELDSIEMQERELFNNMIMSAIVLGTTCWNPSAGMGAGLLSSILSSDENGATNKAYTSLMNVLANNRNSDNGKYVHNPIAKWDKTNSAKISAAIDALFASMSYVGYDRSSAQDATSKKFLDKYFKPISGKIKGETTYLYDDYFDPILVYNMKKVESVGIINAGLYSLSKNKITDKYETIDDMNDDITDSNEIAEEVKKALHQLIDPEKYGSYDFSKLRDEYGTYNQKEVEEFINTIDYFGRLVADSNVSMNFYDSTEITNSVVKENQEKMIKAIE